MEEAEAKEEEMIASHMTHSNSEPILKKGKTKHANFGQHACLNDEWAGVDVCSVPAVPSQRKGKTASLLTNSLTSRNS